MRLVPAKDGVGGLKNKIKETSADPTRVVLFARVVEFCELFRLCEVTANTSFVREKKMQSLCHRLLLLKPTGDPLFSEFHPSKKLTKVTILGFRPKPWSVPGLRYLSIDLFFR